MNIGFDAKRAYHNGTGLGNYSRSLIQSLAQYYGQHQYYSFNPKPSTRFATPPLPNVHEVLPSSPLAKTFPALWRSKWMTNDLKKQQIDLYHGLSNELPSGISATGIPSVVTIHDLIFEKYPEQYNPIDVLIYRKKYRYACRQAQRVIAISEQTKRDLVEIYKVPAQKIEVCYQSCHPQFEQVVSHDEKEAVRKKYGLPERYFLSVGSIIERKNLMNVCRALLLLKDKMEIPLMVIGDGKKYKRDLKHFLAQHGLTSQVIFLKEKEAVMQDEGFRSGQTFPHIYQMAEALVYPSLYEGFGIPVLEALWSRIPVITSNTSCLPEAGGAGALYVDPHSPQQIADAMLQAATDKEHMQQSVEIGLMHAQTFSLSKTAAAVMAVYQQLF